MWAALECDPSLSVSELARQTYGSFATAWRVKRDFNMLAPQPVLGHQVAHGTLIRRANPNTISDKEL
jgi:hypothetical protein